MLSFGTPKPLAERMRPQTLSQYVGQSHLLGEKGVLKAMLSQGHIPSLILWGPPGVGKTSLARLLADTLKRPWFQLSAISAGVKELREVIDKAKASGNVILFIDEIHRFNKSQQDALLGAVEQGWITLIGATTENPSFEVNSALLSRCRVYTLQPLSEEELLSLLHRALAEDELLKNRPIDLKETRALLNLSGGDARMLLGLLELVVESAPSREVVVLDEEVIRLAQQKTVRYDKAGEQHYDIISAFIKSLRGSDPNAAVYWLARMIEGGEDPLFIARRMVILASEDIGNANPNALLLATSTFQACQYIGWPESRIILSQCATYLAASAKSNAAYVAINQAQDEVRRSADLPVPLPLRNAPTKLMKEQGYGQGYRYAHDYPGNFAEMDFLPEALSGRVFYQPGENAREEELRQRLRKLWGKRYGY